MKVHQTKRSVQGLQPKQKNIIVCDEEVVGFGVRIVGQSLLHGQPGDGRLLDRFKHGSLLLVVHRTRQPLGIRTLMVKL